MSLSEAISKIRLSELRTELFKRRNFDFITHHNGHYHSIQDECLRILTDDTTRECAYGGAAGGAKSWTGCGWLAYMCEAFPGTRWFIGREELKRLRESTFQTFIKVCKAYGIEGWRYNGQDHFIQFTNGSRIDLLDLKYLPSDPLYERYGSIEYTGGWIEEGGEVNFGAYDTLRTRIGRHLNDKYGIIPKLFVTLNPKKNWCHTTFWKPFKTGALPAHVKFLQALVTDNPFIDSVYIEQLHAIKDKTKKQRLLFGNFDYDDDDNALMDYDTITNLFTNEYVAGGTKYITADIARFGRDNSVIMLWSGFRVESVHVLRGKSTTEVSSFIKHLAGKNKIGMSNVIVDEDGVGGGVVDQLNCKGFVNNGKPMPNPKSKTDENYKNLKTQCYYMLSEVVNTGEMYVHCENEEIKEALVEELEQVKKKNADSDGKLEIVPKDEVKELLGRSPDYSDTLMMRMYFELSPVQMWAVA
jgi:hypothetical protein